MTWYSLSTMGKIIGENNLKKCCCCEKHPPKFSYTQILEPTVDLAISCLVVTSWLVMLFGSLLGLEVLKLLVHTCSIHNKCMSALFYASLNKNSTVHQYCAYAISNPCRQTMHIDIDNFSLLAMFVFLFQWILQIFVKINGEFVLLERACSLVVHVS